MSAQNNCLHFDGNQWVSAPVASKEPLSEFTLEARFKSQVPFDRSGFSRLLSWNFTEQSRIEIGCMDGVLTLFAYPGDSTLTTTNVQLNDSLWHHVAYVQKGSTCILYFDGRRLLQQKTKARAGKSLFIGTWYKQDREENWNGCIDEVRIWKIARTEKQIAQFQSIGIPQNDREAMLAYYRFNEGIANGDNTRISSLQEESKRFPAMLHAFKLTGSTSNFVGENQAFPPAPEVFVAAVEPIQTVSTPEKPPAGCNIPKKLISDVFINAPINSSFEVLYQFFQNSSYQQIPRSGNTIGLGLLARDTFYWPSSKFYNWDIIPEKSFVVLHSRAASFSDKRKLAQFEAFIAFSSHEKAESCAYQIMEVFLAECQTFSRHFPSNNVHHHSYFIDYFNEHCYQYGVNYSAVGNASQFVQLTFSNMKE